MKRHLSLFVFAIGITVACQATAQVGTPIFQENFDGLTLGPSANERVLPTAATKVASPTVTSPPEFATVAIPNAFTHTPPAGWVVHQNFDNFGRTQLDNATHDPDFIVGNIGIGNQGSVGSGIDEWEGWSFADSDFWLTADDQGRAQFRDGLANHSIVAVADNDEYDDGGLGLNFEYYNTGMTTNNIPVAGKSSVNLTFDSSWDDETFDDPHKNFNFTNVNNQAVVFYASFDGGTPQKFAEWNSDSSDPDFKNTAYNEENVSFPIAVPVGAQQMKVTFAQINAANDWWWAIDNLEVNEGAAAPFWTENFESVAPGPSVNEVNSRITTVSSSDTGSVPAANAFTHTPPAGWNIDNAGVLNGVADDDVGVFEWEGWSFSTKEFSTFARNGALASFAKSTGNYAIADSDAYNPLGGGGGFSSILETPAVNITGTAANALKLQFDSAWRTDDLQTAIITVQYGAGAEVEVLRWSADPTDPDFHFNDMNETVFVDLANPAGATSALVRFKYEGVNDWWWAIDNIKIGTAGANVDTDGDGDRDGADFLALQRNAGQGIAQWKTSFGSGPVSAVPEPSTVALLTIGAALVAWRRRGGKA